MGALFALHGKWQKLDKIRILMGARFPFERAKQLSNHCETISKASWTKVLNRKRKRTPFLKGAAAVAEAMRNRQIECRVYSKKKFHAKAHITHGRLAVIGWTALVGSSNFTLPGLTQNIELNIQIRAPGDVSQFQAWYEKHWDEGEDITPDVISVVERQIAEYPPFQVYAKALQELFKSHELPPEAWEQSESKMYPILDQYQKEAIRAPSALLSLSLIPSHSSRGSAKVIYAASSIRRPIETEHWQRRAVGHTHGPAGSGAKFCKILYTPTRIG
jgi:phosphatidylserine/phosphatidylglycerophosphate/cardiolipin synthase-like enzyme